MNLNEVHVGIHKNKKPARIGRGPGSGHGKTAAKGHKGQRSRAGWNQPFAFQGGGSPLVRRIPKRGFFNSFALTIYAVNVSDLNDLYADGDSVTPENLAEKDLAKGRFDQIKILGDGELTKKLTVSAHKFSATAKEKIEKAGGTVVELPGRVLVEDKKNAAKEAAAAAKKAPKKAAKKK
jgi:large subunit ribosomal protein L15